ncbi:hypothetical protein [Oceanicaulis sp. MMSF_3324]|uniref:hypothetical protein n=1 Tax=Oceanicaulis sp. MMSF_3324 TaxID=3046702 RepID=UPI0027401AD0|nr:hypothetical protein [Oceanicaulis sp. MMSF_3324]
MRRTPALPFDSLGVGLACGLAAGVIVSVVYWDARPPVDVAVLGFVLIAAPVTALAGWAHAVIKAR